MRTFSRIVSNNYLAATRFVGTGLQIGSPFVWEAVIIQLMRDEGYELNQGVLPQNIHEIGDVVVCGGAIERALTFIPRGTLPGSAALELIADGYLAEAYSLLQQLIVRDPRVPDLHYILGLACSGLERYPEAVSHYQAATGLDPGFTSAWIALGLAFNRCGNTQGAVTCLEQAIAIDPYSEIANRNLGSLLTEEQHFAKACGYLRQALVTNPDQPKTLIALAIALEGLGRQNASMELLAEAHEICIEIVNRHPQTQYSALAEKTCMTIRQASTPIR